MTTSARPRVVYWNNIPSPYIVDRFNAIADQGEIDLEAWFNTRTESYRSWDVREADWRFAGSYLPGGARRLLPELTRRLRARRPDLLVTLYGSPLFAAGILIAKTLRLPVVLHAMRTYESWQPRSSRREAAKRLLFPRVDGFYVPGADSAAYIEAYGARPDRIQVIPEAIRVRHFELGAAESRGDLSRRQALGLEGCVFLYVGRLWRGKGLDYLFDAYEHLYREGTAASLVLVGDGVDEDYYRARAADLKNVVFSGFVQAADLPSWYGLADAFVFPTLGDPHGYVVQEAMAAELPVITTSAAGDIGSRVIEGETGFIVPPADTDALYARMKTLAADSDLRARLGAAGNRHVQSYTVANWAATFAAMVRRLTDSTDKGMHRLERDAA